jgi:hypothetical protein
MMADSNNEVYFFIETGGDNKDAPRLSLTVAFFFVYNQCPH